MTSNDEEFRRIVDNIQEKFDPLIEEFNDFKTHTAEGVDQYPYFYLDDLLDKFRALRPWLSSQAQRLDRLKGAGVESKCGYSVISQIGNTANEVQEASVLRREEREKAEDEELNKIREKCRELCAWVEAYEDSDDEYSDDEDSDDEDSDDEEEYENCKEQATIRHEETSVAVDNNKGLADVAARMQKLNVCHVPSPIFSSELSINKEYGAEFHASHSMVMSM